jgi:putative sterol carrier protein
MKFLSNEWIESAKKITKDRLDPKEDLRKATTSLLNIIENIPPNSKTICFYISVNNGIIDEMIIDDSDSLLHKNAEFVVIGNYDTYVQIFKGEMSITIALIKNRVKVKGDKIKALKFVKPIDRINNCLREIKTEYY